MIYRLKALLVLRAVDYKIAIWKIRVTNNVCRVVERQHIVVIKNMLDGIEGADITVDPIGGTP